ncbi:hypothetical protein EVAR_6389_1 [Eumeta japonica]|uniref:Uncharacterized protein n=1 Tax=Eumeta variegata TaxID=151549 RepID=A0A4C1TCL2_EUMVA|nr:hypothetical protein EVAR_6389_1 [Eumeta japonica]
MSEYSGSGKWDKVRAFGGKMYRHPFSVLNHPTRHDTFLETRSRYMLVSPPPPMASAISYGHMGGVASVPLSTDKSSPTVSSCFLQVIHELCSLSL